MAKGMRRKNRQIKMTASIPDDFDTEEDFMEALMEKMDRAEWNISLCDTDELLGAVLAPVSKMQLGDIEIGPEEEED
jgi:hypothetical protein